MELTPRQRGILRLLVETYIEDGKPVSSTALAKRGRNVGVSAATIRSIMSELEALGLLHQPHVSAGRAPTETGFRVYVDCFMNPRLHPWDRTHLEQTVTSSDPAKFSANLGHCLAELSGHMAVVWVPRFLGSKVREIGLVRCGPGRFLAVFISPGGLVQQKLVDVEFDLEVDEIQRIQNFLNQHLKDRSIHQIRAWIQQQQDDAATHQDNLCRLALEIGQRAIPEPGLDMVLVVEGASHLANKPEFADLQRLHTLLKEVEGKRALLQILDRILDTAGVRVMLSSEHHVAELPELACVGAMWSSPGGQNAAAISVMGPTRMDYGRLVPMIGYASDLFGHYWERL